MTGIDQLIHGRTLKRTIRTSQSLFELSFELLNSNVPFSFISTLVTSPRWLVMVLIHKPETTSQNRIVVSFELCTHVTRVEGRSRQEEERFHVEQVRRQLRIKINQTNPVTMRLPSGLKIVDETPN